MEVCEIKPLKKQNSFDKSEIIKQRKIDLLLVQEKLTKRLNALKTKVSSIQPTQNFDALSKNRNIPLSAMNFKFQPPNMPLKGIISYPPGLVRLVSTVRTVTKKVEAVFAPAVNAIKKVIKSVDTPEKMLDQANKLGESLQTIAVQAGDAIKDDFIAVGTAIAKGLGIDTDPQPNPPSDYPRLHVCATMMDNINSSAKNDDQIPGFHLDYTGKLDGVVIMGVYVPTTNSDTRLRPSYDSYDHVFIVICGTKVKGVSIAVTDIVSDIHGYLAGYENTPRFDSEDPMYKQIEELYSGKKLYLIGHSLAGGLCDAYLTRSRASYAVTFNPVIDMQHAYKRNDNYRSYLSTDPVYGAVVTQTIGTGCRVFKSTIVINAHSMPRFTEMDDPAW